MELSGVGMAVTGPVWAKAGFPSLQLKSVHTKPAGNIWLHDLTINSNLPEQSKLLYHL